MVKVGDWEVKRGSSGEGGSLEAETGSVKV